MLVVNTHLRDWFGRRGVISIHTVQRRLSEANLSCRRPYAGAILSRQRRANRVLWARQHLRWTLQQWDSVVFSDESRFCVRHMDGRRKVYRRPGERYADCCVYETDRWGGWESCCLGWDQHQPQDWSPHFQQQRKCRKLSEWSPAKSCSGDVCKKSRAANIPTRQCQAAYSGNLSTVFTNTKLCCSALATVLTGSFPNRTHLGCFRTTCSNKPWRAEPRTTPKCLSAGVECHPAGNNRKLHQINEEKDTSLPSSRWWPYPLLNFVSVFFVYQKFFCCFFFLTIWEIDSFIQFIDERKAAEIKDARLWLLETGSESFFH